MINLLGSWQSIKNNALKAVKMQVEWQSMVKPRKYRLRAVLNDRLIIMRPDGSKDVKLTRAKVEAALRKLNKNKGKIRRSELLSSRSSAEVTALVLFHPRLGWSDDRLYILEV